MTDDELQSLFMKYPADHVIASAVLRLLAEKRALQAQVEGHCERIAAQSALLSKRSEEVAVLGKRAEAILDSPLMGFGMTEEQMQAILDTSLWPGSCNEDGSAHRFAAGALTCYCGQFENPFDGSTGMSSTIAGRKSQGSGA